jgi:hypothetical protein
MTKESMAFAALVLGVVAGIVGIPGAHCAGACAGAVTGAPKTFGLLALTASVIGLLAALFVWRQPALAGWIMIAAGVLDGATIFTGNLLAGIISAAGFVIPGLLALASARPSPAA